MTGSPKVKQGQKYNLQIHDADDPPTDEKGWPLYARRLDDGLTARGPKRVRGNGSYESPFRYNNRRCKKPRRRRPSPSTPARWRASLGSSGCVLWTDLR